jgi:regulator of protease activity HflC (stomatin/prohibitin superfamily)
MKIKLIVTAIMVLLIGFPILFGSWYTIDQGERGVVLRNGAFTSESEPGLHFKIPFIDKVVKISTQSRIATYQLPGVYSQDQQPANMVVSVNYRMNAGSMGEIYETYGGEDGVQNRLLSPQVQEEVKTVFSRFDAVAAIQQRDRLNVDAYNALQEAVSGPVTIDTLQIEGIDFSDAYEKSIEDRMLAEVEVQRIQQNLERERVQAEIVITQANAMAEQTRVQGQAEADAINARGAALANNPALVSLVQAERWNGVLPTTMIPSSTVPIIGVDQLTTAGRIAQLDNQ